jgi:translation initiation factor 2B subunit (eIF-2B alpha/beta/delta family)
MPPRTQWDSSLDDLSRDTRSGAQEIATRAMHLLIDTIGDSDPAGAISYRQWLLRISRQLVAAQPAMGILFRLVNDMLWAADGAIGAAEMRQAALDHLQQFQAREAMALFNLVETASAHLAQYRAIMTYSRSSTVLRTLSESKSKKLRVYCSEGRPMYEGQTLASELGWAGVQVILGIDMSLFSWLPEVEALIIGADSLGLTGLVNKIGTAELVRAAAEIDIPRIVLTTTSKFMPNDFLAGQHIHRGDPEEIMPVSSSNVDVRNITFDVTPLELITMVISEKGPLQGEHLLEELDAVRTYPGLRRASGSS